MKRSILIIEDDPVISDVYSEIFKRSGFRVSNAKDGEVGMAMIRNSPPDVLLLDLQIPKLSGVEVLRQVRSLPATERIPVVVFTNTYLTKLMEEAWQAGATKVLTKTRCKPNDLVDAVEKAMTTPTVSGRSLPKAQRKGPLPAPPIEAGGSFVFGLPGTETIKPQASVPPPFVFDDHSERPSGPIVSSIKLPSLQPVAAMPPKPVELPVAKESSGGIQLFDEESFHAEPEVSVSDVDRDLDVGSSIRKGFCTRIPDIMDELREKMRGFVKSERNSPGTSLKVRRDQKSLPEVIYEGAGSKLPELFELCKATHSLAGYSAMAGFARVAQLSQATESFLRELHSKPKNINPSTLRTLGHAADMLEKMLKNLSWDDEPDMNITALGMVVDDDPISRRAIHDSIEFAGFKAVSVANPEIALNLVLENRFDIIFLDVEMPEMSGFDLCRAIRADDINKLTPVVYVTSLAGFDARTKGALSGGTDYIAKPFLMIELALKTTIFALKPSIEK